MACAFLTFVGAVLYSLLLTPPPLLAAKLDEGVLAEVADVVPVCL